MQTVRGLVNELFGDVASKTVSRNDKDKQAYVLDADQRSTLERAGLKLTRVEQAPVVQVSLIADSLPEVEMSYYLSTRSPEADRVPEARAGRAFIRDWLNAGDEVLLATDGQTLFACKNPDRELTLEEFEAIRLAVLRQIALPHLDLLVKPLLGGPPLKRQVTRSEFQRSAEVVEIVLRRADGVCEMPGCSAAPILTLDGGVFLEVHHVQWLRNGGVDHPANAAAVCPRCHRALHHGRDRAELEKALLHALGAK